ncbi:MAG TPA: zinc-dependent alcohol dehydrogenase family protein [Acidimicrobiales bacterium]|nr:zinc-dependent alcohol dehydrogenase family protein [Acidimicrobiales bacterium]
MLAWVVDRPSPIDERPLRMVERDKPLPGPGQVRVRVRTCGVCRTDLHLAEGDLAPRRPGVTLGHEVVGEIDALGDGSQRFRVGDRIGIAWLRRTCGTCRFCISGRENLCVSPLFTGWDEDGGYAEFALVDERFAYSIPERFSDLDAAPLLCSGIIGYRALRRANLPRFGRLGIYGFGASAHLAAQIAIKEGASVHVLTRSVEARQLALDLGAASAGDASAPPPEPLDAAILFAPVGSLVPVALEALDRGGTLAIAGIHLTDIPRLNYDSHLFGERTLTSVTANTRADGQELLLAAGRLGLKVMATSYPLEKADTALADLAHGRLVGAAVITVAQ